MKNKKILTTILVMILVVTLTGCFSKKEEEKEKNGLAFKQDYEAINGLDAKKRTYRTVTISEDNAFIETTPEKMIEKMDNGDSFYIYFGSRLCPWCRSVIEKADEVSRENDIEKIYYIDIWDDEGNEIFRDKYELNENNELVQTIKGTDAYNKMLERFSDYLRDYFVKDSEGNEIPTGEKRIYAPNFVYISHGKISRLVTGKSTLLKDPYDELTEEMLKEEQDVFEKFFINVCDDAC